LKSHGPIYTRVNYKNIEIIEKGRALPEAIEREAEEKKNKINLSDSF